MSSLSSFLFVIGIGYLLFTLILMCKMWKMCDNVDEIKKHLLFSPNDKKVLSTEEVVIKNEEDVKVSNNKSNN